MKINVKIAVIAFLIVIAVNITVVIIGFAGKSPNSTSTLQPTATATATSTSQPGSTVSPYATPTATLHPTVTSVPSQTPAPTASPTTSKPTQTATPTATQTGATPTPEPTSTPSEGGGGGGGGGALPTPTPTKTATPTPTQTPTTIVSVSAPSQVNNGNTFTADINIAQVSYLTYAFFDLEYNAAKITYISTSPGSVGAATPTISAMLNPNGVQGRIRIYVDFSSYAAGHGGNGISGSGTLCRISFTADASGTSQLDFVEGQGSPPGELTLIRWISYSQSVIANVGWTNSSITVVN